MRKISYIILLCSVITCFCASNQLAFAQDSTNLSENKTDLSPVDTPKSENIDSKNNSEQNLPSEEKLNESNEPVLEQIPEDRENWLESLISTGKSELFKSQDEKVQAAEKKRIEKKLRARRSNAANFDIAGVKLRMNPTDVENVLLNNGYRRILQEERVPNFVRWRGEELCRINGVVGFERLKICTENLAKENGLKYVAREIYYKNATRENIEIFYTSVFTDNLSHFISYKSLLPLSASKASQYVYINNLKIYDFWRRIDLRYGQPDNTSEVKWGLGGKKPYLKASTGKLELVDPILKDLDAARMLNEDSQLEVTPYYTF